MTDMEEMNEKDLENISGGMITFEPLRKVMKKHGISTYTLQEKYDFNPAEITRLKYNHDYTKRLIDKLCEELHVKPSDIFEFVDDDKQQ